MTGDGDVYREFWARLGDRIEERPETPLSVDAEPDANVLPQTGRLPDGIDYALVAGDGHLRVALRVDRDAEAVFPYLHADRTAIEEAVGRQLEWSPEGETATVAVEREGDLTRREAWPEYLDWFVTYGETFDAVFRPYLAPFERD